MLSAGGQCGRCGISLNHRCDPEEQWNHDPWNYAHSSNEAELTLPLSTNLRLSSLHPAVEFLTESGILHNFLEIFSFSRITERACGCIQENGRKGNAENYLAPGCF